MTHDGALVSAQECKERVNKRWTWGVLYIALENLSKMEQNVQKYEEKDLLYAAVDGLLESAIKGAPDGTLQGAPKNALCDHTIKCIKGHIWGCTYACTGVSLELHLRSHLLMRSLMHKSVQNYLSNSVPDAALEGAHDSWLNDTLEGAT